MSDTTQNWCPKCGKPINPQENSTLGRCTCPPEIPALTGWRCPNCGAGLSPFTTSCPHCAPKYNITYNPTSLT